MFTCPEKDIHSIYLDNELPKSYIKEYENHVANCEKCKAQLERLKKLRTMFAQDNESLKIDDVLMSQSFDRLQSRLKFHKVISYTSDSKKSSFTPIKFTIPAAAAAAVLAVIIPVRMQNSTMPQTESPITPIVASQKQTAKPISQNNIVVNGNIDQENVQKLFQASSSSSDMQASFVQYGNANTVQQDNISEALAAIDIFRPEFGSDENTIQIRITIPTVSSIPINSEIRHISE